MRSNQFGLKTGTLEKLRAVFLGFPAVEKVMIYGSRAKGNERPGSDIDLTLVGAELTTTDLLRIETEIEELMLVYKVDLSIFSKIENAELLEHISRVGVQFYP